MCGSSRDIAWDEGEGASSQGQCSLSTANRCRLRKVAAREKAGAMQTSSAATDY